MEDEELIKYFNKKDDFVTSSYDDVLELGFPQDVAELYNKAKKEKDENKNFNLEKFFDQNKKDYFFNFLKTKKYKYKKPVKSKNPIYNFYYYGGLAVDCGTVTIADFFKGFHNIIYFDEFTKLSKEYYLKKDLDRENGFHSFTSIGDGLYPIFIGVDKFNKVNKIFIDFYTPCYFDYENRGELPPSKGSIFYSNYWEMQAYDAGYEDFKKKNAISNFKREKIFELKINSNYISVSDSNRYRFETTKEVYKKFTDEFPEKDSLNYSVHPIIPVDNGSYSVYLHTFKDQKADDLRKDRKILVIEDIQGCFLNKDSKGRLIFQRKMQKSRFLKKIISEKETITKIDAIDLRESKKLSELESLKDVKILTLCNFFGGSKNFSKNFNKLKNLKRLYLLDSGLYLGKNNKFEVINKSTK